MGSSYTGDDNLFAGLGCDHASSLQAFLDECMEFHEKNEQERTKLQDDPQAQTQEHPTENESQTVALIHPNAMSLDPQQLLEEGTARAKIILERMKELTAPALLSSAGTSTSLYYQNQIQPNAFYTPKDFRCLREQGLAQEAKRKRLATFRNFEYLSKRHEQRAHVLNQQIEHSRQVQQQIQAAQQASLQARQARINQQQQHEPQQSTYSINSKPSFPSKKVQGQVSNKEKIATDSIALYISGLPTEEPLERLTSILNQLFTEFGLLKKIHLYRNKQTGKLKGDGLVIYNSQEANPHDLVERACAQSNGVQLPCGSIISVEPASSNSNLPAQDYYGRGKEHNNAAGIREHFYQTVATTDVDEPHTRMANENACYGPSGCTLTVNEANNHTLQHASDSEPHEQNDGEDDLDDFFASLE